MRKIFLFVCSIFSIFLLFSCDNGENKEPVYEEPTYEDVMSIDSLNYLHDLEAVKVNMMIGYNDYVVYEEKEDIDDIYALLKDVTMNKCYKIVNEKYSIEYRAALKDIEEYLQIEILDANKKLNFFVGISGYLYYFKNNFIISLLKIPIMI